MISSNMTPDHNIDAWYEEKGGRGKHKKMVDAIHGELAGIDRRVLEAMRTVRRDRYVDKLYRKDAYNSHLVLIHDVGGFNKAIKKKEEE